MTKWRMFYAAGVLLVAAALFVNCPCGFTSVGECLPGTCSGCCGPMGECLPGDSNQECGAEAAQCSDCQARSQVCSAGACVPGTGRPDGSVDAGLAIRGAGPDAGCPQPPCVVGSRECVSATETRQCVVLANGCQGWMYGTCTEGRFCVAGRCDTVPDAGGFDAGCVNECAYAGQWMCMGPYEFMECVINDRGCLLPMYGHCPMGGLCQAGQCVATPDAGGFDAGCVNECAHAGQRMCVGVSEYSVCVTDLRGCLRWQHSNCGEWPCLDGYCRDAPPPIDAGTPDSGPWQIDAYVGIPCGVGQCGPSGICITTWPQGGYCTAQCSAQYLCPAGSACVPSGPNRDGWCLSSCPDTWAGQSTCRSSYVCYGYGPFGSGVCLPHCRATDICLPGQRCDDGGYCQ